MDGDGNGPVDSSGEGGPPPTFEAPPAFGAPPAASTAPPTVPPLPPAPPDAPDAPDGASSSPPGWRSLTGSSDADRSRPIPTLTSMLAVGGGLLVAAGLFFLLGELDGYDQRMVGLVISVIFLVLGVAISTINRSSRAAAAGVAISALAVVPLTVFLWANADVFGDLSGSSGDFDGNPYDGIRGVVTLMLASAAVVWLAGYLLGPGRRFGIYLGAALVAIWLIPVFHLQINAWEDTFSSFETSSSFDSGFDSSIDSGSGFDSEFDDPSLDEFDSSFEDDFTFEEPDISDPSTKMGVISLVFGAAYLGLAGWRDRKGDARMATAALVPAIGILLYANALLTGHIGWVGSGFLSMAVGAALLAVGLRGGRRASSWIGILFATGGLGSLVAEGLTDSPRAIGAVLVVIGVVVAVVVGRTAPRAASEDPAPSAGPTDPTGPFGPGDPAAAAVGAPATPWTQPAPAIPAGPASGSPWGQPAAPTTPPPGVPGGPGTAGTSGPQSF